MKKKNEKAIVRIVVATGITSVVVQLVTLREFLVQFKGNEYVIALILFVWLMVGGIGTLVSQIALRGSMRATAVRLAWLSMALIILSVLQLVAIRVCRDLVFTYGTSVGFYPTFFYIVTTVAPYCLLLGFLLPYSLYAIRDDNPEYPAARIYITDNMGDVTGGVLFSFVLVHLTTPLTAVAVSALPLLIAAGLLAVHCCRRKTAFFVCAGLTTAVLAAAVIWEPLTFSRSEGKIVDYRESRYGRIVVREDNRQYTVFSDGIPVFSSQDLVAAEETVHYPLSQLSSIRNLLFISIQGGMMEEIAKYDAQSIDYVELDPEISKALFHYGLLKKIPGLNVIHEDGRALLARSKKRYDAIVVCLPEPETFQVNRFFTDRFFALVQEHLKPDGIFSFSMEGYDNYLAEPQRKKLSSLRNTAAVYFKAVRLLPGQRIYFLCSQNPLRLDIPALLAEKNISTRYIRDYFHGNVTPERIQHLEEEIDPTVAKNRDGSPELLQIMFEQWFARFSTSPHVFFIGLAVLLLVYLIRTRPEEFVLMTTGCMTMGAEILVIFAFQIYYGYIYHQIGLIVTVFLAGLLPGAWYGDRLRGMGRPLLLFSDFVLILLMLVFLAAVHKGGGNLPVTFFMMLGFAVSLVCGVQFPVALHSRGGGGKSVARAFSADLVGAACGTIVTCVVLIPWWGIEGAAVALVGVKLASLTVTVWSHG